MESKWWLNSTTVRGALLTLLPTIVGLLKLFGVEIDDTQTGAIVDGISGLVGLAGVVIAIYGRIKPRTDIRFNIEKTALQVEVEKGLEKQVPREETIVADAKEKVGIDNLEDGKK